MRTAAILLTLTALAACADPPVPKSGDREAAEAAAADDPRIMLAHPEATNYAPPDWTLKPGDVVRTVPHPSEWTKLGSSHWGKGVVWVVNESGLGGAIPFGAGFVFHVPDRSSNTYIGHMPVQPRRGAFAGDLEEELPEALRGLVDIRVSPDGVTAERPATPYRGVRLTDWLYDELRLRPFRKPGGWGQGGARMFRELLEEERARYYGRGVSW